jgi:hypothetical protein
MRSVVAGALSWPGTIVAIGLLCASFCAGADPVAECRQALEQPFPGASEKECSADDGSPLELRPILSACPQQTAELLDHPWAELLARDADTVLLGDLGGLHQVYQLYTEQEPRTSVDMTVLRGVLAELERPPEPAPSWWELAWRRLLQWLRDHEQDESRWFENIAIGESLANTLLYGSIALLVILALGIVAVELRHGLAGRRGAVRSGWHDLGPQAAAPPDFEDLASLPLREQPRMLLRIVLARLEAADVLRLRSSATHRHITAAVSGLQQAEAIALISAAAERAIFGNWHPTAGEIALLREQGRKACHALGATRQ